MADQKIFENYLEFRFQRAGALTLGQKLDVVRALLEEARQGNVPTGPRSVARLPVEHPAVQAVLRGEEISLGSTTLRRQADWKDVSAWSTPRKLMLLGGIVLLMLLLGAGMLRGGNAAKAAEVDFTPTPTLFFTPTPDWPATLTAVALEQQQRLEATPPPPPPPPTATPTAAFLLGKGGPAESGRDPASIEVAGRLFVVTQGKINEQGQWQPQGPEWLAGTEVRRVFAIPYQSLADAQINPGDPIYVRTRGGQVIVYQVRDVIHLLANQIETLTSLEPSIVVALPFGEGDVSSVERIMIFGAAVENNENVSVEAGASVSSNANAVTLGAVNLRSNPGMRESQVIIGLQPGTPLMVLPVVPVTLDGHDWLYVLTPYGYGWVARDMILMSERR
jgi:hypothetical protein